MNECCWNIEIVALEIFVVVLILVVVVVVVVVVGDSH
jgi:hypothetical protein